MVSTERPVNPAALVTIPLVWQPVLFFTFASYPKDILWLIVSPLNQ